MFSSKLRQRRHQGRLPHNPGPILRYDIIARPVVADDEWIAPFARPPDIDPVRRRPLPNLSSVKNVAHRLLPLFQKTRLRHDAGSGRVKDALGAAERDAGVPILSSVMDNSRAAARSLRSAKLEEPRLLGPAGAGIVEWAA